jgi:cytochrome c
MIRCHVLFAELTTFAWMVAPALAADGDAIAGKAVFQRTCQNCHAVEIGVNKIGPVSGMSWDASPPACRTMPIRRA